MKRTILFSASLASALGLFALGATAQAQTAQTQERMSIGEISTMLEGQGYNVLEIELERGRYDVDMLDGQGRKVEAYLDPATGEVLPYRADDRYDDDGHKEHGQYHGRDDD
jgi:hypothetical protein